MENLENNPLLINTTKEDLFQEVDKIRQNLKFPHYLFSAVIVLFACAGGLQSKVVTLYLYKTLEENNLSQNYTKHFVKSMNSADTCFHNNTSTSEVTLQKEVSHWLWHFKILESGLTCMMIIIIGINLDRCGRKPFMVFCLIGSSIKFGLTACIVFSMHSNILLFLAVYSVGGLSGGKDVFGLCTLALIADITERNNRRTLGFAVYDVLIGIGMTGAEIASGYLIQGAGYSWPCVLASLLSFLGSLMLMIFVPETLDHRRKQSLSVCNRFCFLIKFCCSKKKVHNNKILTFNLSMAIFTIIWFLFCSSITTLYELGPPFCWTPEDIGWFASATILSHLILGIALIKILQSCLQDEYIAFIGCVSAMGYTLIFGLATSSWMLYIATIIGVLSITPLPVLRAIMSRLVKENKQELMVQRFEECILRNHRNNKFKQSLTAVG